MNLKIEYISTNKLKPYEKNTRRHEKKDVDNIAKSIEKYGMCDAIGVWGEDNIIVEGHGRLMACKKLGIKEVPIVRLDHLTDEQRREYAIAHNATAELSVWDKDFLAEELDELDLSEFDFDFGIEAEENTVDIIEDEVPEVDEEAEPITKLGDIWQLGRHRLMCGDSTDKATVELLMNGNKADMVFTDPPYDMDMGGQGCLAKSMRNCKKRTADIIHFDPYVISYLPKMCTHSFYVFTSKNGIAKYIDIFKDLNYDILVWCKTNPTPFTSGSFLPDVEYLLYFSRKGRIWNNSLKPTSVYKKYYITQKLQGRKDGGGDLHPTMKPTEIVADKIRVSSNKGGVVLDIFGGSGTTLAVCQQIDRICYTMELNPKYCDVIIKRWETLTGEKAVKIN